ncbi:sensor histidine kinase [Pedobacter cryophilus]|uniref:histidine kinase n=1 Tax=Pedobacter cryophilus TaxID=2571271 RepID=A0A4U1C5Y1_9SPHI|nr:HAMP domain-containing sensor histidine kinase [Pedobacter cryophilus]TKC00772.1 HAMP domain-containing histidine kinase [Pedobacter cryophilus]
MKIQSKITLLFLGLSVSILLLFNAFILYFQYQFNFEDFFKRLDTRVNLTAQISLFPSEKSDVYQDVRNKYLEKLDSEQEYVIKADRYGKYENKLFPKSFFQKIITFGSSQFRNEDTFYSGKVVLKGKDRFIVIVLAKNPYGLRELQSLRNTLFVGFLISIAIIFFVGKVFSAYTFEPVRKLTKRVKTITSSNLHFRLEEPKGKDEIAELTNTFNEMLNRLETAFETQNNFVSNASHELRTPLTIINSEADLALSNTKINAEQIQVFKTIKEEANKLTQILKGLLLLAQSGYDGKNQSQQKIRIDETILSCIESVKKINSDGKINVDFDNLPDNENLLIVNGYYNVLCLALTNIIGNACKYSKNKLVTIKLTVEKNNIVVSVTDLGIGIPQSELQHIFVPFFRASNTHEYEGHGVGLPLTLNIIRLHKGTIGIRSKENEGTEIQVFLPIASV